MFSTITSAFAIYIIVWWVVLFAVLPFGVRSQHEDGETVPGSDPGAPVMPRMARKLVATTLVSAVLFAIGFWAYSIGFLTLDRLAALMGV